MAEQMREQVEIKVAESRVEVHFHRSAKGEIVVDRVVNLDHGFLIECTTPEGSAFDTLAADCAEHIRSMGASHMDEAF